MRGVYLCAMFLAVSLACQSCEAKRAPFVDRAPAYLKRNRLARLGRFTVVPGDEKRANCTWPHPQGKDGCRCNGTDVVMQYPPGDAPSWKPKIYQNENYNKTRLKAVMLGIKAAREVVGSMAPVSLFFFDTQKKKSAYDEISRAFCWTLSRENTTKCDEMTNEYSPVRQAERGEAAAFNTDRCYGNNDADPQCPDTPRSNMQYDEYIEEPVIVFVNVISDDADHLPYFATRGTHEYTHTFQSAYLPGMGPAWLAEGSAEFNAYHAGANATDGTGWPGGDHPVTFHWSMVEYSLKEQIQGSWLKKAPNLKLQDIESMDEQRCSPQALKFARELAYDAGAWAIAYIVHLSGKSQLEFWRGNFWPSIARVGWKAAVADYTGLSSIDDFYNKFDKFIRQDTADITAIINGM